ncbi:MAG: polysaccharide pyruvyl transferase family protein [Gammaproteobacteria bacterium]
MIIEIRKAGFQNKGAELMLLAIVRQLRSRWPEATLTMVPTSPGGSQPFARMATLGFHPKASVFRRGVEFGDLAGLLPGRLRRVYGLIIDREVDVVLDAAGFAYSDQWGPSATRELAGLARRWRRRGTRLVLMPQAFGPFDDARIAAAIRSIVDDAALVFARDATSFRHLSDVVGARDNILQYPDFTNLIEGALPPDFDSDHCRTAIVPNYRMLDKADDVNRSRYVPFMVSCIQRLRELEARPFLLVHEGVDDERLARTIANEAGGEIPLIGESDPLALKGILGASQAVVASRYHALVSALSQGVPALATGWSHKYRELFADYGFPEGLLDIGEPGDAARMLESLVDPDRRAELASRLTAESDRLKQLTQEMWQRVASVIDEAAG